MIKDLNEELESINSFCNYDIVVAGSGPAGITVAMKMAEAGKKVALLEGGGLQFSVESQDLYALSKAAGDFEKNYFYASRLRYFGGTSNHWAGRCRPSEQLDFAERAHIYAESGWPIGIEAIEPYLAESKEILDIPGDAEFKAVEGTVSLEDNFIPDVQLNSPPTRFGVKYLDHIKASETIDLFVNASVVDIVLGENLSDVNSYVVSNYKNQTFSVAGKQFVLAMGAIENARILLNSDSQVSGGIGNSGGMVGACYMDHYNVRMGEFLPEAEVWQDVTRMSFYTSEEYSRKNNVGSSNVTLSHGKPIRTYGKLPGLKKFLANRACAIGWEASLKSIYDFDCPRYGVITTLTEQEPSRTNRVLLTDEIDALGIRRVKVDWNLTEFDKRTLREIAKDIAIEIKRAGLGEVKLPDYIIDDSVDIEFYGHAHHLGTTRMATSADDGVVDENCKVFGTSNLFVAGSSIFSRGGGNNPTMQLVQFALRLSDHLQSISV